MFSQVIIIVKQYVAIVQTLHNLVQFGLAK